MITIFPPKHVSATLYEEFNFISLLDSGETITGVDVECEVTSGEDANPSALLSGAPVLSGYYVQQLVTGGEVGVIYLLTCTVATSLGATKVLTAQLAVLDSTPYEAA